MRVAVPAVYLTRSTSLGPVIASAAVAFEAFGNVGGLFKTKSACEKALAAAEEARMAADTILRSVKRSYEDFHLAWEGTIPVMMEKALGPPRDTATEAALLQFVEFAEAEIANILKGVSDG